MNPIKTLAIGLIGMCISIGLSMILPVLAGSITIADAWELAKALAGALTPGVVMVVFLLWICWGRGSGRSE